MDQILGRSNLPKASMSLLHNLCTRDRCGAYQVAPRAAIQPTQQSFDLLGSGEMGSLHLDRRTPGLPRFASRDAGKPSILCKQWRIFEGAA